MSRAVPTGALLSVAPTTAGPERVAFPAGYKGHVLHTTIDRPENKTVCDLSRPRRRRLASPPWEGHCRMARY